MIRYRYSDDRGHADHGWLNAFHSFSFSEYYDPKWMGYGALRVINEDRVAPWNGFGAHPHRDMEIITYVMSGTLQHRDSTGGMGDIKPGELQVMHAGTGIRHSEQNPTGDTTHLLQIWIEPNVRGVKPGYEQSALPAEELGKGFTRVVAPMGEAAPFNIHSDASLSIAWAQAGQDLSMPLSAGRKYYLHIAKGEARLGEKMLVAGDAAMLEEEGALDLRATQESQVLLFELA